MKRYAWYRLECYAWYRLSDTVILNVSVCAVAFFCVIVLFFSVQAARAIVATMSNIVSNTFFFILYLLFCVLGFACELKQAFRQMTVAVGILVEIVLMVVVRFIEVL